MTDLLDRLDDKAAATAARWDRTELAGWACVIGGGLVASVSFGVVAALYLWGDLL